MNSLVYKGDTLYKPDGTLGPDGLSLTPRAPRPRALGYYNGQEPSLLELMLDDLEDF